MAIMFPSDEWVKAAMEVINRSEAYQQAAAGWEGDITFVITALPGEKRERYLYMDLWHGTCRAARELGTGTEVAAEFAITAPLPVWRKVLAGDLDPIRGLLSRQLKMKGNMMKVMKAPKAAVELVNCCAEVDTAWPA